MQVCRCCLLTSKTASVLFPMCDMIIISDSRILLAGRHGPSNTGSDLRVVALPRGGGGGTRESE